MQNLPSGPTGEVLPGSPSTANPVDTIIEANVAFLRSRSVKGITKYGVTLDRTDLSREEWLDHLMGELADALNYARKLRMFQGCTCEVFQP